MCEHLNEKIFYLKILYSFIVNFYFDIIFKNDVFLTILIIKTPTQISNSTI